MEWTQEVSNKMEETGLVGESPCLWMMTDNAHISAVGQPEMGVLDMDTHSDLLTLFSCPIEENDCNQNIITTHSHYNTTTQVQEEEAEVILPDLDYKFENIFVPDGDGGSFITEYVAVRDLQAEETSDEHVYVLHEVNSVNGSQRIYPHETFKTDPLKLIENNELFLSDESNSSVKSKTELPMSRRGRKPRGGQTYRGSRGGCKRNLKLALAASLLNDIKILPSTSLEEQSPRSRIFGSDQISSGSENDSSVVTSSFRPRPYFCTPRRSRGGINRASLCKNGLNCREHDVLAPTNVLIDNCIYATNIPAFAPIRLMNYGDELFEADIMMQQNQYVT